MASEYYYTDGKTVMGPFDVAAMQEHLTKGTINAETLVAEGGSTDWAPLSTTGLASPIPPPPPVPIRQPPADPTTTSNGPQIVNVVAGHGARLGHAMAGLSGKVVGDISHLRMLLPSVL